MTPRHQEEPHFLRVSISAELRRFLLRECQISGDLRSQLEAKTGRLAEVWVDVDEAGQLREQATDILQTRGFDSDYRPTVVGAQAEALIDVLANE